MSVPSVLQVRRLLRLDIALASQSKTDFLLAWIGISFQQCLGSDDKTRRADPTLQRGAFEETLLNRVQLTLRRNTFHGFDFSTLGFDRQHATAVNRKAVHHYRTGTTIAIVATFLAARQSQLIAEHFEEAVSGFTEEFDRLTIDRSRNVDLFGQVKVRL